MMFDLIVLTDKNNTYVDIDSLSQNEKRQYQEIIDELCDSRVLLAGVNTFDTNDNWPGFNDKAKKVYILLDERERLIEEISSDNVTTITKQELLAINPQKPIVCCGGISTFETISKFPINIVYHMSTLDEKFSGCGYSKLSVDKTLIACTYYNYLTYKVYA